MKLTERYWNGFILKEWTCCGNLWQLLMSKKFNNRNSWEPTCECKKGNTMNDLVQTTELPLDPPATPRLDAEGNPIFEVHVQTDAEVEAVNPTLH